MRKHRLTAKSGKRVTLSTDDTFTLALGDMEKDADWQESTPSQLVAIFGWEPLHKLYKSPKCGEDEKAKLRRALQIN